MGIAYLEVFNEDITGYKVNLHTPHSTFLMHKRLVLWDAGLRFIHIYECSVL
jgi:hypothetical protein